MRIRIASEKMILNLGIYLLVIQFKSWVVVRINDLRCRTQLFFCRHCRPRKKEKFSERGLFQALTADKSPTYDIVANNLEFAAMGMFIYYSYLLFIKMNCQDKTGV